MSWTQGRINAFVMSVLRKGSTRWPPKWDVLEKAKTEKKKNPKTGRLAQFYTCASCGKEEVAANIEVDHIDPVIPETGFTTWDDVITNLFCSEDKLQVLCTPCHKKKSKEENARRKTHAN